MNEIITKILKIGKKCDVFTHKSQQAILVNKE